MLAKSQGGDVVLRIEDLDAERSRREYADHVMRILEELGLEWDSGPFCQSDREDAYREAFEIIKERSCVYPCFCTRADLASASAPHGIDGQRVYNRKCLGLSDDEVSARTGRLLDDGRFPSFRLKVPSETVSFEDILQGPYSQNLETESGDFVLRRSDGGFAYNLAVVVDDIENGINLVTRGHDLLSSTPQQIHLYRLLGHDAPDYAHFPLLCAPDGRRLAKRNKDAGYYEMRERLGSPEAVLGYVAHIGKLQDTDAPITAAELLEGFSLESARGKFQGVKGIEVPPI